MHKQAVTIIGLLVLVVFRSQAQTSTPPLTSFSHFYFVMDSLAYQTLATDKFCTDTLFYSKQSSIQMDQGTWSGNYLTGPSDYWEVFHPFSLPGAAVGQVGLGEILHKFYEADILQEYWSKMVKDSVEQQAFTLNNGKDTVIMELLNYRDSMLLGGPASFFVMYYHPVMMAKGGFSGDELTAGIDQKQINQKWYYVNPYQRLYNKTEKIHLTLTPQEYERHRLALLVMGYKEVSRQTFKKEIEIGITVKEGPKSRLKKIEFSLKGKKIERTIVLSPRVYIRLEGGKGELVME